MVMPPRIPDEWVLQFVQKHGEVSPMMLGRAMQQSGMDETTADPSTRGSHTLNRLYRKGLVVRAGYGLYRMPGNLDNQWLWERTLGTIAPELVEVAKQALAGAKFSAERLRVLHSPKRNSTTCNEWLAVAIKTADHHVEVLTALIKHREKKDETVPPKSNSGTSTGSSV